MSKKKNYILLIFLILFSIYCALTIGQSWDGGFHLIQGKITLDYLFSLGKIDEDLFYRELYSPIYWSLQYLLTQIFPKQYEMEVSHLINLSFAVAAIVGIKKLSELLFNKEVGKIIFLILFFYPIFFGHMAFNSKDIILAFCHVWILYLVLLYLKKQQKIHKSNNYIIYIGILAATATGIQIVFLGSLIPIFLFVIFEIFFFKKFISKTFSVKKFIYDLIRCFLVFYSLLILFWIDAHQNIFTSPLNIFVDSFNTWTGWSYNLINGDYYISSDIPKSYFLTNIFFKSPEYLIISYIIFLLLLINPKNFFSTNIKFFNYKLIFIITILIFPTIVLFIVPHPIYDGLRLFLWTIPYFCIIPGLTFYYLIKNFKFFIAKLFLSLLTLFTIYFLLIFFSLTPYQYTYLNIFSGKIESRYKKFENDYWGASIKELIKNINLKNVKDIKFATCGINPAVAKNYLKKNGYRNFEFAPPEKANYIIMTNRVVEANNSLDNSLKLTNCFDKFEGSNISEVKRFGLILSVIRQLN